MVALVVVLLDQLTKWWAVENLTRQDIHLFWTLRLNLAFNKGAAFSLGQDHDYGRFIPLVALVVVALVLWQGRTIRTTTAGGVALGLVLGGALGNLIDRLFRAGTGGFMSGGVVDFIDFQWFPIFNVADSAITVGAILLGIVAFFTPADDGEPAGGEPGTGGSETGATTAPPADADATDPTTSTEGSPGRAEPTDGDGPEAVLAPGPEQGAADRR